MSRRSTSKSEVIAAGKVYHTKISGYPEEDELSEFSPFGSAVAMEGEALAAAGARDSGDVDTVPDREFPVAPGDGKSADPGAGQDDEDALNKLIGSISSSEEEDLEEDRYETLARRRAEAAAADPGLAVGRPMVSRVDPGKDNTKGGGGFFR